MVNSKIYSRRVAQKLGLRQPVGYACDTLQAWSEAVAWARELLLAGRRVAVKDAYGVSGKGISVVSDGRRLDRLDRMTCGNVQRTGGRPALVVEEWVAKTADLNYQFTVARDGRVRFDFVKEAVKNNPIPRDFGGNILKLAIAVKDNNKFVNHYDGPKIFAELSHMVASCLMLNSARQSLLGTQNRWLFCV